jgi:PQQ-like domain
VTANGLISAATSDGHGGWFIAGGFTTVDGRIRPHLAHVNDDGALDASWRPPLLGPSANIEFLSVARIGSTVFVAGGFRSVTGHSQPGLIALNATSGAVDQHFHAHRLCADGNWEVRRVGRQVLVATACAAQVCLVKVSADTGRLVTGWPAHIQAIGEIECVGSAVASSGSVMFTGGFSAVGSRRRDGIAAVSAANGQLIAQFAPSGSCAGDGHAIAATPSLVFVGGDHCPIAAFSTATGHQRWSWPRRGNATTAALVAFNRDVYVAGSFTNLAGVVAHGLAVLDQRTGKPIPSWHPPPPSQQLESLTLSGTSILIGAIP